MGHLLLYEGMNIVYLTNMVVVLFNFAIDTKVDFQSRCNNTLMPVSTALVNRCSRPSTYGPVDHVFMAQAIEECTTALNVSTVYGHIVCTFRDARSS